MAINRFFKPVEYEYTPIPFDQLMAVGKELNTQRALAEKELATNLKTFGKFVSPSAIDMLNYKKESIDKLAPFLELAAANPEVMKDAAWRANMQAQINNIDYAKLGMLEQSADTLREGLKMRAKMEAEGLYNEDWDLSDIPNYDTLGSGRVFSDITPVKYMTANELSNKYFDDLKAGDLGSVWRDGIKYRAIGNSIPDLETIYDTHENDLINSPQGKAYMRQFIVANNGDIDAAREDFRSMILASQMDRTLRPTLQVDTGYYTALRARAAAQPKVVERKPTRQENISGDISKNVLSKYNKLPQDKYDEMSIDLIGTQALAEEYNKAKELYQKDPSNENLIAMNQRYYHYQQAKKNVDGIGLRAVMTLAFEDAAKFKLNNKSNKAKNYSREGYIRGVNNALDSISSDVTLNSISDGGDPMITKLNGIPTSRTQTNGSVSDVYRFNNSYGFMLPESVFQLGTGTQNEDPKRDVGAFRGEDAGKFALRHALESGQFMDVEFIPQDKNGIFQYSTDYVDYYGQPSVTGQKYIRGKLRIPAEQLEQLGTGTNLWFVGRQSTPEAIKDLYGAKEIKYGEDKQKYYEINIVRQLPIDATDNYWKDINSIRENSPSNGGIGGASQASDMQPDVERAAEYYNNPQQ